MTKAHNPSATPPDEADAIYQVVVDATHRTCEILQDSALSWVERKRKARTIYDAMILEVERLDSGFLKESIRDAEKRETKIRAAIKYN